MLLVRSAAVLVALATVAVLVPACPEPTEGPAVIDQPGPVLVRVLVQDETASGGRRKVSDILDANAPAVAIGTPIERGGNQIRLVFDRELSPGVAAELMSGETVVRLSRADGMSVPAVRSYEGTKTDASPPDPIATPPGPAIVLKPLSPLAVKTTYFVLIDNARIKDTSGNVLRKDVRGQVKTSYGFTTEGLYVLSAAPDVTAAPAVAPNTAIVLTTNADVDEESARAGVGVVDARGRAVGIEVFAWRGASPSACAPRVDARRLVIVPVSSPGVLAEWPAGTMALSTTGVADRDTRRTVMRADPAGSMAYAGTFRVMGGRADPRAVATAYENFALPEDCGAPRVDAGVGVDAMALDAAAVDSGPRDAALADAALPDAALPDAAPPDARADTGVRDTGPRMDATPDAGLRDAAGPDVPDAPAADAPEPDASEPDTGEADAEAVDAAAGD